MYVCKKKIIIERTTAYVQLVCLSDFVVVAIFAFIPISYGSSDSTERLHSYNIDFVHILYHSQMGIVRTLILFWSHISIVWYFMQWSIDSDQLTNQFGGNWICKLYVFYSYVIVFVFYAVQSSCSFLRSLVSSMNASRPYPFSPICKHARISHSIIVDIKSPRFALSYSYSLSLNSCVSTFFCAPIYSE